VDIKSQIILNQLIHIYSNTEQISTGNPFSTDYSHYHYDLLYDFLISEGVDFNLSANDKKKLYKLSKIKINTKYPPARIRANKNTLKKVFLDSNRIISQVKAGEISLPTDIYDIISKKNVLTDAEIDNLVNDISYIDKDLIKIYKGYLVRAFIINQYKEGKTLKLINIETNKEIKRFELVYE
jgi:hypothetical protein